MFKFEHLSCCKPKDFFERVENFGVKFLAANYPLVKKIIPIGTIIKNEVKQKT